MLLDRGLVYFQGFLDIVHREISYCNGLSLMLQNGIVRFCMISQSITLTVLMAMFLDH